ncbi:MAG: PTS sugar transporter subunit IIA [Victivallales bacterium]|nr:PTS sugar transporter subunit IIA [Victivallales bacterium]
MSRTTLTLNQAAEAIGLPASTLRTKAVQGEIRSWQRGEELLFFQDDLDLWYSEMLIGNRKQLEKEQAEPRRNQPKTVPSLSELCPRQCVTCALPGTTRASILKALTDLAEKSNYLYDPADFLKEITKREEAGSTNLGNGIAIPHTMTREIGFFEQTFVCIAKLATPSYFNSAPDGSKTELLLLSCSADSGEHLAILCKISAICRETSFVQDVREATTDEEVFQALLAAEEKLEGKPGKKRAH